MVQKVPQLMAYNCCSCNLIALWRCDCKGESYHTVRRGTSLPEEAFIEGRFARIDDVFAAGSHSLRPAAELNSKAKWSPSNIRNETWTGKSHASGLYVLLNASQAGTGSLGPGGPGVGCLHQTCTVSLFQLWSRRLRPRDLHHVDR